LFNFSADAAMWGLGLGMGMGSSVLGLGLDSPLFPNNGTRENYRWFNARTGKGSIPGNRKRQQKALLGKTFASVI